MSASHSEVKHNYADRTCKGGKWTGLNIFAMVLGFIFFWPVGLFLLYWIIRGRDVRDIPAAAQEKWMGMRGGELSFAGNFVGSDNVVFAEYQKTQYYRIQEIKDEIRARGKSFAQFRGDAKRRADEEEFKRFMSGLDAEK